MRTQHTSFKFQIPEKVSVEKTDDYCGTFTFRPLERGYGVTIGNSLRRVLLSSLEGYAITSIQIPGVKHEFSTIAGVVEDVVELILNLKQVRFKRLSDKVDNTLHVSINNKSVLTAEDIVTNTASFAVVDPNFVICNLNPSVHLTFDLTIARGRGYILAEENRLDSSPIGVIPIDSIFGPIKNVQYHVEETLVGQKTDYEKLMIEIKTDGTILPEEALRQASNILIRHFLLLSNDKIIIEEIVVEGSDVIDENILRMRKMLNTPLGELGLSVRAFNCLKIAGIRTLGELAQLEVTDMIKFRNFGKKSLAELEALMNSKELVFGMDLGQYRLDD